MERFLRNNTVVKIIASLLAVLLWLTVQSQNEGTPTGGTSGFAQISREIRDKSVEVIYDDRNYSLVGEPKVNLTLRGSVIDVTNSMTSSDDIKVTAIATSLKEGVHEVPAIVQGLPTGVSVDDVSVTIRLEANVNKEVPVTLNTEGTPKDGLNMGEAMVSPKTVVISGGKTAVDAVDKVVATLSLEGAEDNIVTSVPLTAVDHAGKPIKNVTLNRDRAEVNVPISKPSKSVPLQIQFKGELAPGYAVESVTQNNAVTLYGPSSVLGEIESYPVPPIDLTGVNKTTTFKVKLPNIEGVTGINPQEADVTVNVVEAVQRSFDNIPIKVTGLKDGESYNLIPPSTETVSVTVEGAPSLVDKLTPQDISVTLDLSNQPAGQSEMHVQINTPNYVKGVKTTPTTVVLEIVKS